MSRQSIIHLLAASAILAAVSGLAACSADQAGSGSSASRNGTGQQVDPKTGTPLPGTGHMGY